MNFTRKMIACGIAVVCITLLLNCSHSQPRNGASPENPTLSVIHNRKSVRDFIPGKPVPNEDIVALIRAAMAAPSGKDTRPWSFVVINDREALDRLARELPTAKMLAQAPAAIVVCGDTVRSSYWYLDCAAATQNLLLAAEALGLGAVWTAAYPYPDRMNTIARQIALPDTVRPLAVVPVGYPQGNRAPKEKYDKSKVHLNRW